MEYTSDIFPVYHPPCQRCKIQIFLNTVIYCAYFPIFLTKVRLRYRVREYVSACACAFPTCNWNVRI